MKNVGQPLQSVVVTSKRTCSHASDGTHRTKITIVALEVEMKSKIDGERLSFPKRKR